MQVWQLLSTINLSECLHILTFRVNILTVSLKTIFCVSRGVMEQSSFCWFLVHLREWIVISLLIYGIPFPHFDLLSFFAMFLLFSWGYFYCNAGYLGSLCRFRSCSSRQQLSNCIWHDNGFVRLYMFRKNPCSLSSFVCGFTRWRL
jgi:hypothetical protein